MTIHYLLFKALSIAYVYKFTCNRYKYLITKYINSCCYTVLTTVLIPIVPFIYAKSDFKGCFVNRTYIPTFRHQKILYTTFCMYTSPSLVPIFGKQGLLIIKL